MCLMENNSCPALNPCIQKDRELSGTETVDRLSELPNELLLLILSYLSTKDVRRTSVISKQWRRWLLGYYPKLNFEDPRAMEKIWDEIGRNKDVEELDKEISIFVRWVDHFLKQHVDSSIDIFRVAFDLNDTYQPHIDRWINFALTKRVKTIELDFQPAYHRLDSVRCGLNLQGINHSVSSLSLDFVNITSEMVENVMFSCPLLENLCIKKAEFLTSIKTRASLVSLKHLDISDCYKLKKIDISAPKMVCFRYLGHPIELNIRNAFSLSSLFIGGGPCEEIAYAFEPMSPYFPQLEVLYLQLSVGFWSSRNNNGVEHLQLPILSKVKVLDLHINGCHTLSLLGWIPLIEACPFLEKLILKFDCWEDGIDWIITKRSGRPLKSLETLEIYGYCGRRIDIEFAAFVMENAINLQHVFVEVDTAQAHRRPNAPIRLSELKEVVPEGVSFTLLESK